LASTRLVFCDETLPNLTKGKDTHPEGQREEQKERTNVPPIVSTHQAQKHIGDFLKKNPNVLNLSQW
jgi:hypothetical protein